jgi:hypothetical protein
MSRAGRLRLVRATAVAVAGLSLLNAASPVSRRDTPLEAALRSHVVTLSSEEFGGREPGTDGETKTLRYLARQWFDIGLESGTNNPGSAWFAPWNWWSACRLPRAWRSAAGNSGWRFRRTGFRRHVRPAQPGGECARAVRGAWHRAGAAARGTGGPDRADARQPAAGDTLRRDRGPAGRLLDAGASAVIVVLDGDRRIDEVTAAAARGLCAGGRATGRDIEAFVTPACRADAGGGAARDVVALRHEAAAAGLFRACWAWKDRWRRPARKRVRTHNLIGKIEGRNPPLARCW